MATFKTPGVYVVEQPLFPPSITQVETCVPVFIGYTQKAQSHLPDDLKLVAKKIRSLGDYEMHFGIAKSETVEVLISNNIDVAIKDRSPYLMYYGLQMFFFNGGGNCYIISVNDYSNNEIKVEDLKKGLAGILKINDVTLIIFPDAVNLPSAADHYDLYKEAMSQCLLSGNKFTILDVWMDSNNSINNIQTLRDFDFGKNEILKYGAAYYPRLYTSIKYMHEEADVSVKDVNDIFLNGTLTELRSKNNTQYLKVKKAIEDLSMLLPSAPAIAGVYNNVDQARGVWKAPANVNINCVVKTGLAISSNDAANLNVDETGRSINAIRNFPGKGPAIIWGARTLDGNNNEWRYISVRRFFNMVEASVKNSTVQFVFEPNDANTWVKVQAMIENFLTLQWRSGALAGSKPQDAFYVRVGLGQTMTELDILEGRMIVETGMAVVRPAEFIILRFSHKMMGQ